MQRALSMRRLAVVSLIAFVIVLALLAGRVRAGADPTQRAAQVAPAVTPSTVAPDDGDAAPDDGSSDPLTTHAS